MSVLAVTGASGFIGKSLISELAKSGQHSLVLIVRPGSEVNYAKSLANNHKISVEVYDGTFGSLEKIFRHNSIELVFHLATLYINRHQPCDIEPLIESNITLGCHLMEAMLATECNLLINAGSYIQNLYSDEFYGSCFYAASKQSLENFVDFYTSNSSLRAITLKFFDTFGEGDTRDKILNIFLNNKSEQSLLKLTPGNQELRLTHVSDIVDALIHTVGLVKKAQTPHEKYFVGSEPITLRQLSIFFEKEAGCKLNIEWGATDYRKNQPLTSFSGKQLPGWKPKLSIKQGLRRFLDGVS